MERRGIMPFVVWRGALDWCTKRAHHPLWRVPVGSSSWITLPAPEKSRLPLKNPRPARAVQASDPHPCPTVHFHPFHPNCMGHPPVARARAGLWLWDNPHYGSLPVVEGPETSENPTHSLIIVHGNAQSWYPFSIILLPNQTCNVQQTCNYCGQNHQTNRFPSTSVTKA